MLLTSKKRDVDDERTVNSKADDQANARTDAIYRLHHVMTSISAPYFANV